MHINLESFIVKIIIIYIVYRSPEEQFHSFSTIGEEELYKLVKFHNMNFITWKS